MTRSQIVGWTIWVGGWIALSGFYYYYYDYSPAHDPAAIAKAKAQSALQDRMISETLAQVGCAGDIEGRDDGHTAAEAVAKAIIAKCGPIVLGPPCRTDAKCIQWRQRISLKVETDDVFEHRYNSAQARADDAKAAWERARSQ